jgi:hypothetical protein
MHVRTRSSNGVLRRLPEPARPESVRRHPVSSLVVRRRQRYRCG